jgi:outer membrane protein, heavy metal efflux system
MLSRRDAMSRGVLALILVVCAVLLASGQAGATEGPLYLQDLIDEAMKNSPDILAAEARTQAAQYRVPQAKSLPDPMFMFGYQNEGFQKITMGEEIGSQGMFSLSQMFYFPGKRALKGEMATRDAESVAELHRLAKLRTVARIKELYYELFLSYKVIDVLRDKSALFSRVEDAALARYTSGMGSQQEAVMAQTEKYMLLEKEEMQKQKIQTLEAMLNSVAGRNVSTPLGRPAELPNTPFTHSLDELLQMVKAISPEVKSKEKMVQGAEAKVEMAKKEYYPDFTLTGGYFPRTGGLLDMWSVTATVNLPIYYTSKQRQAVFEAQASLAETKRELLATEYMAAAYVRENFSMFRTAERLMKLYKEGLLPKANQDVELALAGYMTGKTEALTAITRVKNLLDTDLLHWTQATEKEKAIARLEMVTGSMKAAAEGSTSP